MVNSPNPTHAASSGHGEEDAISPAAGRPAISVLVFPVAGITSSRNNAPGCEGQRFGFCFAIYSAISHAPHILAPLMILFVVKAPNVTLVKLESKTPRSVYVNRVS